MGNTRALRRRSLPRGLRAVIVLAVVVAGLIAAAPASAAVHPYTGSDVTRCWSCHSGQFTDWKASTIYTLPAYGELKGHNVTMTQTLTDAGHNTDELLTNDCISCHSPFSARHMDGATATNISELVTPVDQTGDPAGVWSLTTPYATAVAASSPVGFWLPAATPSPAATQAAWEGISCRECHDVTNLNPTTGKPTLSYFDPATYTYSAVPTITPSPSGSPYPDVVWLCDKCHQPNGDDSRNALTPSVHAGLSCIDCHGADPSGAAGFNHNLDAGQKGDAIAATSCAKCHSGANAVNPGHPDVTTLNTSLTDHAKFAADPASDLQFNANKWQNIHYITCDTCHRPTLSAKTYTIAYGGSATIKGHRVGHALPAAADTGAVTAYTAARGTTDFNAVSPSSVSGGPGTAFTMSVKPLANANTTVFLTQAIPLVIDPNTLVQSSTFPGLGRGVQTTVFVKVKATLKTSAARVRHGKSITLTATILPDKTGKKVTFQKSTNGRTWTNLKTKVLAAGSTVKLAWRAPTKKGKYFFRVKYAGDSANAANTSAKKTVTVF